MNRRTLITTPVKWLSHHLDIVDEGDKNPTALATPTNRFANVELPQTPRSRAGLAPYSGPWTYEQAAHLLRRTLFGPKPAEIQTALHEGLSATLNQLLTTEPLPPPPVNYNNENDPNVPLGETWVYKPESEGADGPRTRSLLAWTTGLLIHQSLSLREKMTLFWHNHFAIELGTVNSSRGLYQYTELLRTHALGNFRDLAKAITINPAMLVYLNGDQNEVSQPNENYARELFELFSIGKGPLIGSGNYTHYTEQDVVAASKVLTGWIVNGNRRNFNPPESLFRSERHDNSAKQFSAAFNNQVISNNGENEYKDLIEMIFGQTETARFICRELYRWFVYYVIDETTEENVIEPLAQTLINHQYDIVPVLEKLLGSEHFFDTINIGCLIKNPIDFAISLIRQTELILPDPSDYVASYRIWNLIYQETEKQQMAYLSPPNVAGWPAYHQTPQFYELWINAATLPMRNNLITTLVVEGYSRQGEKIIVDPLQFVLTVSDPLDVNILLDEWAAILFPQPLTANQKAYLKEVLIPGLPDFEWTLEYTKYLNNPTNDDIKRAVDAKLRSLLYSMMSMAEYHLS